MERWSDFAKCVRMNTNSKVDLLLLRSFSRNMAKKKLSFDMLLSLLIVALVFAALSNIGWYRITDWLYVLGITFLILAIGIYVYLYIMKPAVATTLKKNSSSLRNVLVIILVVATVTALAISMVGLVIWLIRIL